MNPTGKMKGVWGEIYKAKHVACTFKSDQGDASQATQILTLNDHVVVVAKDPIATLTCDRLVYYGAQKFFKAIGHVQIVGTTSSVGTIDELWATPDLKKFATPDMFKQP